MLKTIALIPTAERLPMAIRWVHRVLVLHCRRRANCSGVMPSARSAACASALGRALQRFWRELDDLIDRPRSWCNQAQQNGARSTNSEGTMNVRRIALACLPLTAILYSLQPAAAEVSEIRLARQQ